ncbi:hypothetical protein SAMN02910384_01906 [Pseudobutyrivibrio sp. ACV-2]|uniref:hypothetical protein n=1 Tax=Pseudobutyrivibrio sp. ACV-2 TaxID=1520801 RepID=UPI000896ADF0|nr:hypothetical protein [Pseudobutyrivibrio sp. ACV-2]SEA60581.1 hypothetical protein SAMN02910384_01906 [Pseudobutyrivibrio sp. ACV-2]
MIESMDILKSYIWIFIIILIISEVVIYLLRRKNLEEQNPSQILIQFFTGIIWINLCAALLFIVHCLFKIHPSNPWYTADWSSGDLLTFIGTVTLGFVSYIQTKRAYDMAEMSDNMNKEFLQIQKREYIPIIKCLKENFCGFEKYGGAEFKMLPEDRICSLELKTDDENEDPILAYGMTLICCDNLDLSNNITRTYEVHLKYTGKYIIKDFAFKNIKFIKNNTLIKEWNINEKIDVSLDDSEEIPFLITLFDNVGSNLLAQIAESNKLTIELEMNCFDGATYLETINITKHLIKDIVPSLKRSNVELMLSAVYEVQE